MPWAELAALFPQRPLRKIQDKANRLGLLRHRAPARTAAETREAKRLHMAVRRAADPDAMRAYQRRLHHANRERNLAATRAYYARRFFWGRAMKLRGDGRATPKDLARLWKAQRGKCALTGRRLDRKAQLDHIQPKARGGADHLANLRWVCLEVNLAKRDLHDAEFIALCAEVARMAGAAMPVIRWIGGRIAAVDAVVAMEGAA